MGLSGLYQIGTGLFGHLNQLQADVFAVFYHVWLSQKVVVLVVCFDGTAIRIQMGHDHFFSLIIVVV